MTINFKAAVLMAAIALIAGVMTVVAAPAHQSTAEVFEMATGDVVGESRLVRSDNGISMNFRSGGLEPGTVATIWWVIFNHPELCLMPYQCSGADVSNPGQVEVVDISVFFAAGHVIGGSGTANYGAALQTDRLTVDPDPMANQLIFGNGILTNPRGAEVHLVLRTHGPKIPHLVSSMVKTFDAGCTTAPGDLIGPNTCMNRQASIHRP
jgi:hypothetical protein